MKDTTPVAVSTGDPAGVGLELILKCLADPWSEGKIFHLFGPETALLECIEFLGLGLRYNPPYLLSPFSKWQFSPVQSNDIGWKPGQPGLQGAKAAWQAIDDAVEAVQSNRCRSLLTCPIHKGWMMAAGFPVPGHTDYLAFRTGVESVVMSYHAPRLKVALVTTHIPLQSVADSLRIDRIVQVAVLFAKYLAVFKKSAARLAIAGLNPHAGSGDEIGNEEKEIIVPAIQILAEQGMQVFGPIAPDTVFWRTVNDEFDGVVSLYHDQGSIPIKTLYFEEAVNVTLGLPFYRTSVDHGTAFDIAGKNIASFVNMKAAADLALTLGQSFA